MASPPGNGIAGSTLTQVLRRDGVQLDACVEVPVEQHGASLDALEHIEIRLDHSQERVLPVRNGIRHHVKGFNPEFVELYFPNAAAVQRMQVRQSGLQCRLLLLHRHPPCPGREDIDVLFRCVVLQPDSQELADSEGVIPQRLEQLTELPRHFVGHSVQLSHGMAVEGDIHVLLVQEIHERNQRRTLRQLREYDGGIHGGQVARQEGMGKQRLLLLPRHGLLLKPSAEASQIPDDRLAGDVIRVFAHEQHGEDLRQSNGVKAQVHRHGDLLVRVILDPAAGLFLQLKPAIDILAGKPAP